MLICVSGVEVIRECSSLWTYAENDDDNFFLLFVFQLAQEFASFGSVDVKILDSQHAVVAVAQHRKQVYEILRKGFKETNVVHVLLLENLVLCASHQSDWLSYRELAL